MEVNEVVLFLIGVEVVLIVVGYWCGYTIGVITERRKWEQNSKPMRDGITSGKMMRSTNNNKPKCKRPDSVGAQGDRGRCIFIPIKTEDELGL